MDTSIIFVVITILPSILDSVIHQYNTSFVGCFDTSYCNIPRYFSAAKLILLPMLYRWFFWWLIVNSFHDMPEYIYMYIYLYICIYLWQICFCFRRIWWKFYKFHLSNPQFVYISEFAIFAQSVGCLQLLLLLLTEMLLL